MNLLTLLSVFLSDKIYYINGSDSLPPPLPPERETELIELLSSGDESAKNELIEHNLRLVVYIARKFENTGINISGVDGYADEIAYFIDCIEKGIKPEIVTPESSERSIKLAERLLASAIEL